jgi:hypothetical protein
VVATVCPIDGAAGEFAGEIPSGSPVQVVDGVDVLVYCVEHTPAEVTTAVQDAGFVDALGEPLVVEELA